MWFNCVTYLSIWVCIECFQVKVCSYLSTHSCYWEWGSYVTLDSYLLLKCLFYHKILKKSEASSYSKVGFLIHEPVVKGLHTQATSFLKQQQMKLFQTFSHASVLWDAKTKPKGIFGGHLNIQSIISKTEQLEHLLTDSNIDYLCLTETWLTLNTPTSVFTVPGYNVYRRDRSKGKGGGVLIYMKDSIQSQQITIPENNLECVGVKISPDVFHCLCSLSSPCGLKWLLWLFKCHP